MFKGAPNWFARSRGFIASNAAQDACSILLGVAAIQATRREDPVRT